CSCARAAAVLPVLAPRKIAQVRISGAWAMSPDRASFAPAKLALKLSSDHMSFAGKCSSVWMLSSVSAFVGESGRTNRPWFSTRPSIWSRPRSAAAGAKVFHQPPLQKIRHADAVEPDEHANQRNHRDHRGATTPAEAHAAF